MDSGTIGPIFLLFVVLVGVAFTFYRLGTRRTEKRIGRRDVGILTGGSVILVLDDLDYSIKRDRKKQERVALVGSRYHHKEDSSLEAFRVSLDIAAQTPTADVLYEMYRAGALHCTLRPFKQGEKDTTEAPE